MTDLLFLLDRGPEGALYALAEPLPERDFKDCLLDADDPEADGPVVQAPSAASALAHFREQRSDPRIACAGSLASELPDAETAPWTPELAATCGVYRAAVRHPERLPADTLFLWDLYRALYVLDPVPWSGPLVEAVARQELEGVSTWGCELGQLYTYVALDRPQRCLRVFNEPTDLTRILRGEEPTVGARVTWGDAGGDPPFAELPAVTAWDASGELAPSSVIYRIAAAACTGLAHLLAANFAKGVPETPTLRFPAGLDGSRQPCELSLFSAAEIQGVLGS